MHCVGWCCVVEKLNYVQLSQDWQSWVLSRSANVSPNMAYQFILVLLPSGSVSMWILHVSWMLKRKSDMRGGKKSCNPFKKLIGHKVVHYVEPLFHSPHSVDCNGIVGRTKHRGSTGKIKISEQDRAIVIYSKCQLQLQPSCPFLESTPQTPYFIKLQPALEMWEKNTVILLKAVEVKLNGSVLLASYFLDL